MADRICCPQPPPEDGNSSAWEAYLDNLIVYIGQLFDVVDKAKRDSKKSGKKPPTRKYAYAFWPTDSPGLKKLKEFLSAGIDVATGLKDVMVKGDVKNVLKDISHASIATAGLLIVVFILERFEAVSTNKTECLSLLKEMSRLAIVIRQCRESSRLKEGLYKEIREAIELIAEGSKMCGAQITSSRFAKFFLASSNGKDLSTFEKKLDKMYRILNTHLGIRILEAIDCKNADASRRCPNAVGIENSIKDVLNLLDWSSEKNVVTIIIHGLGGSGKTTLAQSVFSRIDNGIQGCKFSKVKLFNDMESKPDIAGLQKTIYKQLKGHDAPNAFTVDGDGQLELGNVLEEVPACIYIDNVLRTDEVSQLLPKPYDMKETYKLRLLITARDPNVVGAFRAFGTVKKYSMTMLSSIDSLDLWEKLMPHEKVKELKPHQVKDMINKCGGMPLMLEVTARSFLSREDEHYLYYRVMDEMEGLKGQTVEGQQNSESESMYEYDGQEEYEDEDTDEEDGNQYVTRLSCLTGYHGQEEYEDIHPNEYKFFAYDILPPRYQDAFLDICRYFKDWDWETVADIVGESELKKLKDSGLVTDTDGLATVHDVIFRISHLIMSSQEKVGVRLKFTTASELVEFLDDNDDKEIQEMGIKGIWLTRNQGPELNISVSKLYPMHKTLRVFALEHKTKVKGDCERGFEELIYFKAKTQGLPLVTSKSKKLRYLHCNFGDSILPEMPLSLKHLELDGDKKPFALEISFNGLQQLKNLRKMRLINFYGLENLPQNLGDVKDLQELTLSNCSFLEELPESISNLQSLKVLSVDHCSRLSHLPKDLGSLSSLQELHFGGCLKLEDLEDSIGQLKLSSLDMSYCTNLKTLPDGFCNLSLITHLSLYRCVGLERLPDRFGELESLKVLNLEECEKLLGLPERFGQLKYLTHLNLSWCRRLTRLSSDFHSLSSLERLDLSHCWNLQKEWMYKVVQLKALEVVTMVGTMFENTWEQIQCNQSLHFIVVTEAFTAESNLKITENILKRVSSQFPSILTDGRGEPFHLSALPSDTLVLLVFNLDPVDWSLIEETIDDISTYFRIIYIGNYFNELPPKVAKGFVAHGPYDFYTRGLINPAVAGGLNDRQNHYSQKDCFQMRTKVVEDPKGVKYLSGWEFLSDEDVNTLFLGTCKRYLQLKRLAETPPNGNIPFLRELFAGKEEEVIFLRNDQKVGFHELELERKMIILEIRHPEADECVPNDMAYGFLMEMYKLREEKPTFEIITINATNDQSISPEEVHYFSREVPWLVLRNPITAAAKYFLAKDCQWEVDEEVLESSYPIRYMIIKPNGSITGFKYVLNMVERWGPKSCLFTDEKIEELKRAEWNQLKTMSALEFIFMHLETVLNQVKQVMLQRKIICLCGGCDWTREAIRSISNAVLPLKDNIHIIYVPTYGHRNWRLRFNGSWRINAWKKPHMPQVEMEDGISLLNLTEDDSIRLYRRIFYLLQEIDKDKQLDGMKFLLNCMRFHSKPWMIFVDYDEEMVRLNGEQEIMKFCRTERLVQFLFKIHTHESELIQEDEEDEDDEEEDIQQNSESEYDGQEEYEHEDKDEEENKEENKEEEEDIQISN